MSKLKLISSLQDAIKALENDSIEYDWWKTKSCNCGVVTQAITGLSAAAVDHSLGVLLKHNPDLKNGDVSWSTFVKEFCPITGEPVVSIFKKLHEAGLTREEILNLEYLKDKKILDRSGIYTGITWETVITQKKFLLFFKRTKEERVPFAYYEIKSNLIKYLRAWVGILKESEEVFTFTVQNTSGQPTYMNAIPPGSILFEVNSDEYKTIIINGEKCLYKKKEDLESLMKMYEKEENYELADLIKNEIQKVFNHTI